jgi:ABC-type transport system involved in cytochrome bd biosynthesis fused ATPase/permease subunit
MVSWLPWVRKDEQLGVANGRDRSVFALILIAAMMLVAGMLMLAGLDGVGERMGMVAAFNVVVSVCLMVFTGAKRKDVFLVVAV